MNRLRGLWAAALLLGVCASGFVQAQTKRPAVQDLAELAQILGQLHHLRPLCGTGEGPLWRSMIQELIESEAQVSLSRKEMLTAAFNQGFKQAQFEHKSCSYLAEMSVEKALKRGEELSESLLSR
jgi:uncharacterized protein (TIGR02301 family)